MRKGFNLLCDGCKTKMGVLTPFGLKEVKKDKTSFSSYFCDKCRKKLSKKDKIKVLKQEIRGIKRTMKRHNPNPAGLRRFNKHLKAREKELIKLT